LVAPTWFEFTLRFEIWLHHFNPWIKLRPGWCNYSKCVIVSKFTVPEFRPVIKLLG